MTNTSILKDLQKVGMMTLLGWTVGGDVEVASVQAF